MANQLGMSDEDFDKYVAAKTLRHLRDERERAEVINQDALYADEPWAKLAVQTGFRPYDTESAARMAFRHCAAQIEALEAELKAANTLISALSALIAKYAEPTQTIAPGVVDDEPLPNSGEYNGYDI